VNHHNTQLVVTVMLDDLVQQSLPRILSIRHKLENGCVLSPSELEFFSDMLHRINICQRQSPEDHDCQVIFATVAHLLYKVISLAMENERKCKTMLA